LWNANISKSETTEKIVYIRPEPWIAQYYKGSRNFLDELLLFMKDKVKVVLLPRGNDQAKHYEDPKFAGVVVQTKALSLEEIAGNCKMFIGAGGTMTRELAVLGIPTISVYQDELLDVDRYLIKNKMMIHEPNLSGKVALEYLESMEKQEPNQELLRKGKETYMLIKKLLLNNLSI
jgi:predicted glycosyltransferase